MLEWLDSLADPSFMPHGHCYFWRPDILWTHVISDAVIALAYYAIPIILSLFLIKRKQTVPFPEIILLFVAFIFLCGTTHLVAIYVTWHPAYEQQGWIKAVTALVSIVTAIVLIPKLPHLITLPGIQQAYESTRLELEELQHKHSKMQTVYEVSLDREEKIIELKKEVNELLNTLGQPPRYLQDPDV